MNKKFLAWFGAFTKRLLLKKFFIIILCIFPLLSIAVRIYSHKPQPLIQVALYNEGNTELAADTIDSLKKLDSTINFYEAASSEDVLKDVKKLKAECGYIFTSDYTTEYITDDTNLRNSIEVVESPASMLTGSINEFIFASYFKTHNKELLLSYLQQPKVVKPGQNMDDILTNAELYFDEYATSENIIQPQKFSDEENTLSKEQLLVETHQITTDFLTNLCRGILSILLLLTALCGGMQMASDSRNGLFTPLTPSQSLHIKLLDIFTPTIFVAIGGFIGITILPAHQPLVKEALGLALYVPATILLSYLLIQLTGEKSMFHILIPFITLGSLIFPPVFTDFSNYARILTIPKYMFLNTYYLDMTTKGMAELFLLGGVLMLLGIVVLVTKKMRRIF